MNLRDGLAELSQRRVDTACRLADGKRSLVQTEKRLVQAATADERVDAQRAHDATIEAVDALAQSAAAAAGSMVVVRTSPVREYAADVHDGLVTLWSRCTRGDGTEWSRWEKTFAIPLESALFNDRWALRDVREVAS